MKGNHHGALDDLTLRQSQCLRLSAVFKDQEIALALGISASTVERHLAEARRRLGVSTRQAALHYLKSHDLLDGNERSVPEGEETKWAAEPSGFWADGDLTFQRSQIALDRNEAADSGVSRWFAIASGVGAIELLSLLLVGTSTLFHFADDSPGPKRAWDDWHAYLGLAIDSAFIIAVLLAIYSLLDSTGSIGAELKRRVTEEFALISGGLGFFLILLAAAGALAGGLPWVSWLAPAGTILWLISGLVLRGRLPANG